MALLLLVSWLAMAQCQQTGVSLSPNPSPSLTALTSGARTASGSRDALRSTYVSSDENWIVFVSDPTANCTAAPPCGTRLYSQPLSGGANASRFTLLSQPNALGPVGSFPLLSPGNGFVLFEGALVTTSVRQLFAVPIGSGAITVASPALDPSVASSFVFAFSVLFRPFDKGTTQRDDAYLMVLPTLENSNGPARSQLYINSLVTPGTPVKLNPTLIDGVNQNVALVGVINRCVVFTANPGSSSSMPSTDPRVIYASTWDGLTRWVLSKPQGNAATSASATPSFAFAPNENYVAFVDSEEGSWPSLYVYSFLSNSLLTGAQIGVPQVAGAVFQPSLFFWTPDSACFVWVSNTPSAPNTLQLFALFVATNSYRAITPPLAAGDAVVSVIGTNNYVVFTTAGVGTTVLPALYSFNLYSAAAAVVLSPMLSSSYVGTKILSPTICNNGQDVTFLAATTFDTRSLFTAPISGATPAFQLHALLPTIAPGTNNNVDLVSVAPGPGGDWIVFRAATAVNGANVQSNIFASPVSTRVVVAQQMHPPQITTATATASYGYATTVVPQSTPFGTTSTASILAPFPVLTLGPWNAALLVVNPGAGSGPVVLSTAWTDAALGFNAFSCPVNSASPRLLSDGVAAPAALQTPALTLSPDRRLVAMRHVSLASALLEVFLAMVDGSVPGGSSSASALAHQVLTSTQSASAAQFMANSQLVLSISDTNTALRTALSIASATVPPTVTVATPQFAAWTPGNDPLQGATQFQTANGLALLALYRLPDFLPGTNANLFSIGPNSGAVYTGLAPANQAFVVGAFQTLQRSFRVVYTYNAVSGNAADFDLYVTSASGSILAAIVAVNLLLLIL